MNNSAKLPLVSVILAVKNGEKYLRQALDSVVKQNYPNMETIVIEGQSTDKTTSIIQSFPSIKHIKQEGTGIANANNIGLQQAKGDFITFISHDDWWEKDKTSSQIQLFIEKPETQYVVGQANMILEGISEPPKGYKKESFEKPKVFYIPEVAMIRRSLFDEIGFFNTEYQMLGFDSEWFLIAREKNIAHLTQEKLVAHKRVHGNNSSNNAEMNKKFLLQMMRASIKRKKSQK